MDNTKFIKEIRIEKSFNTYQYVIRVHLITGHLFSIALNNEFIEMNEHSYGVSEYIKGVIYSKIKTLLNDELMSLALPNSIEQLGKSATTLDDYKLQLSALKATPTYKDYQQKQDKKKQEAFEKKVAEKTLKYDEEYKKFKNALPLDGHTILNTLIKAIPGIANKSFNCPANAIGSQHPKCKRVDFLSDLIQHINDGHKWTRHQIADWLESLDVDLQFKPKEDVLAESKEEIKHAVTMHQTIVDEVVKKYNISPTLQNYLKQNASELAQSGIAEQLSEIYKTTAYADKVAETLNSTELISKDVIENLSVELNKNFFTSKSENLHNILPEKGKD